MVDQADDVVGCLFTPTLTHGHLDTRANVGAMAYQLPAASEAPHFDSLRLIAPGGNVAVKACHCSDTQCRSSGFTSLESDSYTSARTGTRS